MLQSPRNPLERGSQGAFLRRIQDPDGFAVQKRLSILNAPRMKIAPRLLYPVPEMGRQHGVVRNTERMALGQGLSVVYVERRDDLSGLDRGNQGGLVDERAPRRVDEDGTWLHARYIIGADQAAAARRQDHVHRDRVGPCHEIGFATRRAPASRAFQAITFMSSAMA